MGKGILVWLFRKRWGNAGKDSRPFRLLLLGRPHPEFDIVDGIFALKPEPLKQVAAFLVVAFGIEEFKCELDLIRIPFSANAVEERRS